MDFITSKQFLQADKNIQETILKWWESSEGDLFAIDNELPIMVQCINEEGDIVFFDYDQTDLLEMSINKSKCIPLLTLGQLISFIEDTDKCKVFYSYNSKGNLMVYKGYVTEAGYNVYLSATGSIPLQTLWKMVCDDCK